MSYYKYMVSVYRSTLPDLNRSLRSSSVQRNMASYFSSDTGRFSRAASLGPSSFTYKSFLGDSHMPFKQAYERACSAEPATYTRAYSGSSGYSNFDYKVMDYASRLDREESTRSYINTRRVENKVAEASAISAATAKAAANDHYRSKYDAYSGLKFEREGSVYNPKAEGIDGYKHYRLSNQTLTERNTRAKSPLVSRELDRYYRTEKRVDYVGDKSSGNVTDFRHYSYRHVPYFGGSDNFQYVPTAAKWWNEEMYPSFRYHKY